MTHRSLTLKVINNAKLYISFVATVMLKTDEFRKQLRVVGSWPEGMASEEANSRKKVFKSKCTCICNVDMYNS